MEIVNTIIDKIRRNRISTTEVTDCLDKSGALDGVVPLNRGKFCVGRVFWAYAYNESNWEFHEQIREVREGDVILVEPFNCGERAIFGALVSKYLILYRQATGIVVRGNLRDVPHLLKEEWPIWCAGRNPVGCYNRKNDAPLDPALVAARRDTYRDAIAVCDDSGVAIIPKGSLTPAFLDRLDGIEELEDIWADCINRRKWDTFDTVCRKKYLETPPLPR